MTNLNPRQTVTRRYYSRLSSASGPVQPPARPGETILTGPTFPQPMYEALCEISPEFLLPGVGQIESDTVTLLKPNPRFVEAYMIGLNHELAGELLWREFPVNLRQTYFHEFWDTGGVLQLPSIHTWDPTKSLGGNYAAGSGQLVLLIRGELLQRYPDALIYAIKAKTLNTLGTEEKLPLFRGRIEPDITFLGFDLSEDQARGVGGQLGWFFVIQEQPTAPRFGLDETRTKALETWNDLSWGDVVDQMKGGHLIVGGSPITGPQPPGPVWAQNAAHMAAILRQRPVRVSIHARRLMPPEPDTQPPPPRPPQHRPPISGVNNEITRRS